MGDGLPGGAGGTGRAESYSQLVILDEPTTALDTITQALILKLLLGIKKERGCGFLLITHDLGVAARLADTVAVMYQGEVVEVAASDAFFAGPAHPYSQRLLNSRLEVAL